LPQRALRRRAGPGPARGPRHPRARALRTHGCPGRLPHRELLRRRRRLRAGFLLPTTHHGNQTMNRFHVHLIVADLAASIRFYTELFGAEPTVHKPDYAKWMLEDPRVNFAISNNGRAPGIDHLGIQTESDDALKALGKRLDAAGGTVVPEEATICCYAQSDKLW